MVHWSWKAKLGRINFEGYHYDIFGGTNCMCAILLYKERKKDETLYDFRDYADDKEMFEKYVKNLLDYNPPKEWTFKLTENKVHNKDIMNMVSVLLKNNQKVSVKPYKKRGE